jgi:ubiquinol-cytochrome c reductase cytochrome c subunit
VKAGHRGHGTRSGRPLAGLVAAAALVLGSVAVVGLGRVGPAAGAESSPGTPDGPNLYLQNCASCHGAQGEGATSGPSLIGVGEASTDFYLRTGRMPLGAPGQRPQRQAPRFSEAEIQALVAHVASFGGDGPPIPSVNPGGDIRKGWDLYTANCAACHAATGAGNAVGGGFVAVGLGQATEREIAEAMLIGPGAMPRFQFNDEERDAIVGYVTWLRQSSSPGGAPIGGFGPVAEGFVAVSVGLTALVLVAVFVGRRSHEGEPGSPFPTGAALEAATDEEIGSSTAPAGRAVAAEPDTPRPPDPETRR